MMGALGWDTRAGEAANANATATSGGAVLAAPPPPPSAASGRRKKRTGARKFGFLFG